MTSATSSPIRICGVPMDLGQARRGVDMGPSAIRYAGLQKRLERLGLRVFDGGNIPVPGLEEVVDTPAEDHAHHAAAIAETCVKIHQAMLRTIEADESAIFL